MDRHYASDDIALPPRPYKRIRLQSRLKHLRRLTLKTLKVRAIPLIYRYRREPISYLHRAHVLKKNIYARWALGSLLASQEKKAMTELVAIYYEITW